MPITHPIPPRKIVTNSEPNSHLKQPDNSSKIESSATGTAREFSGPSASSEPERFFSKKADTADLAGNEMSEDLNQIHLAFLAMRLSGKEIADKERRSIIDNFCLRLEGLKGEDAKTIRNVIATNGAPFFRNLACEITRDNLFKVLKSGLLDSRQSDFEAAFISCIFEGRDVNAVKALIDYFEGSLGYDEYGKKNQSMCENSIYDKLDRAGVFCDVNLYGRVRAGSNQSYTQEIDQLLKKYKIWGEVRNFEV